MDEQRLVLRERWKRSMKKLPPIKMPTAWDLYPLGLERKKSRITVALILAAAAAAGTALISSVVVARAGGFPTAPW